METRDSIISHPMVYVLGCASWIPLGIWIFTLMVWTVQGDIDLGSGIIGTSIAVGLGVLVMRPPTPLIGEILFVAILTTVVLFPFLKFSMDRRALSQIDVDAIRGAYEALGQRPNNPSLRFRLAKSLYNRGLVDAAIAVAEQALSQVPVQHFREEVRALHGWRQYGSKTPPSTFTCLSCQYQNARGDIFCQGCGAPFLLPLAEGKWLGGNFARKLLAVWGVLILIGVGVPTAVSTMPKPVAALLVLAMLCVGSYAVVKAFVSSPVTL